MEYKLVYRPYAFSALINTQSSANNPSGQEATEFSKILNEKGKDRWRVINSGTITSDKEVVFWALLERQEVAKGVILG